MTTVDLRDEKSLLAQNVREIVQNEIRDVTPEQARYWLEHCNPHNRTLNEAKARRYARPMKLGRWRLNGQVISFDKDGNLVDGQHRLLAIVLAGITVRLEIRWGLEPDARPTVDTGWTRSLNHVYSMEGYPNASTLSATSMWIWRYLHSHNIVSINNDEYPLRDEMMDFLENDCPDLSVFVSSHLNAVKKSVGLKAFSGSATLAFWYLTREIEPAASDRLFQGILTGEELKRGDPALAFRRSVIEQQTNKAKIKMVEQVARLIRAWNAEYEQRELNAIRGTIQSSFPRLSGDSILFEMRDIEPPDGHR